MGMNYLQQSISENKLRNPCITEVDLPPKKESSYNVSKIGEKGGIDGKENLFPRANHQQARGSQE